MHDAQPIEQDDRLHQDDAEALEALIDAEYDLGRVPEALRPRAEHAGRVLGLLETEPGEWARAESEAGLTRRTLAGVGSAAVQVASAHEPELSIDDQEALDAWVMSGYDARRTPTALRTRATQLESIAAIVLDAPHPTPGERSALIERTLAAVQRSEAERADRMTFPPAGPRRTFNMRDLVSLASVAAIAMAVVLPIMGAARHQQQLNMCASNMASVGGAFGAYAFDHADRLPMATAGIGGGVWWNVGTPRESNSANLFNLARHGYAKLGDLACPGNPTASTDLDPASDRDWRAMPQVSYSYRIMFGQTRPSLSEPSRIVLMTDRSPVVPRAAAGESFNPWANSQNHAGRGQHVLFSDGSASFEREAVLANGDNLWLPASFERAIDRATRRTTGLRGVETPESVNDTFVGP
ncbi:MAG: hypothetical protein EA378_11225 [Phycisphaerales bacterium]|nr:MAG: hypothetical protein EA378_11225 [Phycisphaerales bacterium]